MDTSNHYQFITPAKRRESSDVESFWIPAEVYPMENLFLSILSNIPYFQCPVSKTMIKFL
jgi:hypothetical protein